MRYDLRLKPEDVRTLDRLCELEALPRAAVIRRALFFRLKELEPEKDALRTTDARQLTAVRFAVEGEGRKERVLPVEEGRIERLPASTFPVMTPREVENALDEENPFDVE